MPSLHSLQSGLLAALLDGEPGAIAPFVIERGLKASRRLEIYRNNVAANFHDSLRSSYPALARLVGADYFRQLALAYQRAHPSRCGDLRYVGEGFADYVATVHGADEYRYLTDIARFEWLCEESLLAADPPPLELERLRLIAPADYERLRFHLHPSLRLFESPYPARRIWEVNLASETPPLIDLSSGAERLALLCRALNLTFHPLSVGEYGFLQALLRGRAFGAALDEAGAQDPAFDASAALQRFVLAGALVDFGLQEAAAP